MNPNISNNNCPTCCANRREDRRIVDEGDDGDTYCADSWHATPTPPATSTVEWHKVKDGDEVIVGGRRIVFRVLPFRADPHPTPPAPDAAHPALIAAARERDELRDRAKKAERERDDWRDTSMAAVAAAHGLDWQKVTNEQIDAMEADGKAHGDKKAMDAVRRLYARWNAAVYDADKVRVERDRAEKERDEARESAAAAWRLLDEHRNGCVWITWHKEAEERANAATARAEKAEALLREAAPLLYAMGFDRKAPEDILSRIDALLDAPTDADRRGEDREAIDAQGGSTPD